MAKLEASLPQKQQDEIDKIESTEPEERSEVKVELKVAPDLKKEAETFLSGANALMQRFEGFVSKLESFGATDESKDLLEKAKAKHQEFSELMEELKKQAELHEKRTKLDDNVKKLHRSFNRAKDNEEKKTALRGKIEQAEEALYQAKKPAEINLAQHEKAIAELETESEKIGGEFKSGETVKWISEKGEELKGEVVGPAERIGSIIVKTEKNPGGFAIDKAKLEKFVKQNKEKSPEPVAPEKSEVAEFIGAAQDFESLKQAIEKIGEIKGLDGKVYNAEMLKQVIDTIAEHLPENKSPLVNLITRNEGLRDKVTELLQQKRLENKRKDFADKDVKLNREYGSVTGWLKRALNSTNYLEAKVSRDEAYEVYGKERAEAVLANVEKMMGEQIKLADSRAEAFNDAKGWGAKIYDVYKNNPIFKKVKQARLIAGLGLLGAGIAGAPVAATLGGGFIAWQLLGRGLGGVGSAVGSYDLMNMLARKSGTKVLSKMQEEKLQTFNDEQGLSKFKRFFNKKVKVGDQEIGARDLHEQKKLELETEHAKSLSDERLDELIEYYEAVVASDGKKPSEDPKYLMLMREKSSRLKKALYGENAGIRDIVEGDAFDELKQMEKLKLTEYLKQKFLVESVLFEKMRTAKGDSAERKKSNEYQNWIAGQTKMQKQYEALTPELQTLVDRFVQNHKQPVMEMLDPSSADELKGLKASEVDEAGVWAADWKLNPVLSDEVEDLLSQNELLSQAAKDQAAAGMKKFVEAVDGRDQKVEQKTAALMAFCEKGIKEAQEMIDQKRTEKGYSAVAWKKVRQAMAILIGVGLGSGFIQKHIMEFLTPSASAESISGQRAEGVKYDIQDGKVAVESTLYNSTPEGLIKSGVLKADWVDHVQSNIKNPAMIRTGIMAQARTIYSMEQALQHAQESGNAKEFKLLQEALSKKISLAERAYGDVFGEPPKIEPPVEVVSAESTQAVEEPKVSAKVADIETVKAPKVIDRPKVEKVVDAKSAGTIEDIKAEKPMVAESAATDVKQETSIKSNEIVAPEDLDLGIGAEKLEKMGILKEDWQRHIQTSSKNFSLIESAIVGKAQNLYLMEQDLLRAKEAGDLRAFNLLKEKIATQLDKLGRSYGKEVFGVAPKIEPPIGTIQPEPEVVIERPRGEMRAADVESAKASARDLELKSTAKAPETVEHPRVEKSVAPRVEEQVEEVNVEHPRVEKPITIEEYQRHFDQNARATEVELDEIARRHGAGSAVSHRADDAFAEMDDEVSEKPSRPRITRSRITETTDETPKPRGVRVPIDDTRQYGDRVKFRNGRLSIKEDPISTDRLATRPRITPEDLKIQKEDPDPVWKKLLGSKHKDEFHYHKPKVSLHEEALHSRARLLPDLKQALEQAKEAGDKDAAYAIRQEMNKIMNSMGGRNRGSFRP